MASIKPASVIGAFAIVLSAAAAGHAQTIEANVPFQFHVQGATLPAGQYELQTDMSSGLVMLRGERGTPGAAFVLTMPASGVDPAGAKPALTFSRYENGYRLTGIWESAHDGRAVVRR